MGLPNRVSAELPEEDLGAVLGGFTTARGKMPFLVELTKEQRKRLVRIDGSAQPWSEKMLQFATQHPEIIPPKFDVREMGRDVRLWAQLIEIDQALTSLKQLVDDTLLSAAVDAYSAALAVYQLGQNSGLTGEGLEDLIDEFGQRFVRKSGKSVSAVQPARK
jgi:hypothetical protein